MYLCLIKTANDINYFIIKMPLTFYVDLHSKINKINKKSFFTLRF